MGDIMGALITTVVLLGAGVVFLTLLVWSLAEELDRERDLREHYAAAFRAAVSRVTASLERRSENPFSDN